MSQTVTDETTRRQPVSEHREAIIIGAGVCGMYMLHRMLGLGVDVTVLEAGEDLGGTWYWNRYPGCRFDSESYTYGYSFSKELLAEWDWTERFSPQPETLRYLNHVADRFDLRPHMQFSSAVSAATCNEDERRWELDLADGRRLTCTLLLPAIGLLSAPTMPRYAGIDEFRGESFHTYNWPHDPVHLDGRRVGVIGTGATGVQLIAAIAPEVGSLHVFQRRPNWCAPLHNGPIPAEEMADIKARYDEIFDRCARTPGGFIHGPDRRRYHEVPAEERYAFWDDLYGQPGFGIWLANFREVLMDEEANADLSAFIADKIRQRVTDPAVAEKLIPKDHGFGVQRVPMETNYFEAYNHDHVHLVDIAEDPIDRIVPAGVRLSSGTVVELDVLIYATGFDAITGAFDRMTITGVGGRSLREAWADGPRTYLGVQTAGFPNMVMLAGPQGASVSTNFPRAIETSVDWASDLIAHMRADGLSRIECTTEAEDAWVEHVNKVAHTTLYPRCNSWYLGTNIPGKPRIFMPYVGVPPYVETCRQVAAAGYQGFTLQA